MKHNLRTEILEILESDARTTPEEIAMMTNATPEEVVREIQELEAEKVVIKYTAVVDWHKVHVDELVEAMIEVKITPQRDYGYDDMARRIYRYDEVYAVYLMAGAYDLSVRVRARTMKDISKFVWEKLAVIDGVTSTVTTFIMRKYKESGVILAKDRGDDRLAVSP